ncbi:hypothetical protein [Actinophytocola sp.]|uniref:hypothetical protein n=1 Tax=Actinophytocola sp. TaxID=1872138 RepID=UPI003D6B37AF
MSTPVRRADLVAGGVASSFGAGLFLGLAPAASLAGRWLLAALLLAALVGGLALLSIWDRPLEMLPVPLRRFGFTLSTLGRLAAAVAVAGTVATYLTPFAALALVAVVTVAAVVGVPAVVVRVAAVVVLAVLVLVVVACSAIAPVAPAVAPPDGGSVVGVLAAAGLLTVCFFGTSRPASPGVGQSVSSDRAAGGRWSLVVVLVIVAVGCLAVAAAALRQLGAARLAVSPAPLRAALAAADASAIEPLLLVGVTVGCAFTLLGVLRGTRVSGIPAMRVYVAAGGVTAVGAVLVPATVALAGAAVLLLSDAAFRVVAVRHRRVDR